MMESKSQLLNASEEVKSTEEKAADPMEVFRKQLEHIMNTYGSADSLIEEKISSLEKDEKNLENECVEVDTETSSSSETEALGEETSVLLQSLKTLPSPEEKIETLLRKYAELLKKQRNEQIKLQLLHKKQGLLVEQRDRLQLEHSRGILARSELEKLCRDLQQHNTTLKKDMLQKCQEDETKCAEIHSHFHNTVVDIQAQIEQHSSRNNKLSQENIELANKLTSIIQQYEKREESWEKIFKQKELQQQLSDAKLEEANLHLKEEEEKHKREKEYLLREAIDKTKKCYTLKEQELQMKKQLLTHAAEWKLQVKELKEQNTVMQAQLVLYSQKFEEFQATLAKSNEVYGVFKQEMEKMTTKMKKLEKEANMWRVRFESCNKALTEMIEERSEKGKELELFTVKIDKLETLCRALQEERKVLYDKIKDIRLQTISASTSLTDIPDEKIPDLEQLSASEPLRNPALTTEMEKLWKEQERLQAFAASLLASTAEDVDASDSEKELSEPKATVPLIPVKPPIIKDTTLTPGAAETNQLKSNQQEGKAIAKEIAPTEEPPNTKNTPKESPPNKEETPKAEPPKADSPKAEPPKADSPKAEPPKADSPKAEPPKADSPKGEPPKAEPLKAEPPKADPSKADPPKAEPPKADPPKADPPKADPPKAEPPKADPPKADPPKADPPKADPPKAEPPKADPSKAEPSKADTPKDEPPKEEPSKPESPKHQLPKRPNKNNREEKINQQNKHTQKSNKLNSVEHKELQPEVETPTASVEAPQAHTQQEPKAQSTKQFSGAKVEPQEASTTAEPQNLETQEPKPAANKAQGKKQTSSKKKGAAKGVKKS